MHEMVNFISEMCGECHGMCCYNFPVWEMKRDGTLRRNRCKKVGTNNLRCGYSEQSPQMKNGNMPCYFWYMGGCPPEKHAKACKMWICPMIEQMIYPLDVEEMFDVVRPSQASLEIYKMMRRM